MTRPIEDISVEEVARRAGVSEGLPFHYFRTKRDFHLAVTGAAADQLLEAIEPDVTLKPLDRLRSGLTAYVDFVVRYPQTYEALLRGDVTVYPELIQIRHGVRAKLAEWTISDLPVRSPVMVLSVSAWFSFVEEATTAWLHERAADQETFVTFLMDAFLAIGRLALAVDNQART